MCVASLLIQRQKARPRKEWPGFLHFTAHHSQMRFTLRFPFWAPMSCSLRMRTACNGTRR
jgi:hypothetical protein